MDGSQKFVLAFEWSAEASFFLQASARRNVGINYLATASAAQTHAQANALEATEESRGVVGASSKGNTNGGTLELFPAKGANFPWRKIQQGSARSRCRLHAQVEASGFENQRRQVDRYRGKLQRQKPLNNNF